MSTVHDLVAEALGAVEIRSLDRYTWFGRPAPRLPARIRAALGPDAARKHLLANLSLQLYQDFYCVGRPAPPGGFDGAVGSASTRFVAHLSDANLGTGYEEPGWEVTAVAEGELLVGNGAVLVRIGQGERGRIAVGEPLSMRMPKEFLNLSTGFYTAVGDAGTKRADAAAESRATIRLYFNLSPAGAIRFLRLATGRLNGAGLPFRCKVLNDPSRFTRCDAVVLYVDAADYEPVRAIVEDLHPELRPFLGSHTPVFTKRLADGIGLAEDPVTGESFGLHRCSLMAEGVIEAWERRARTVDERLAAVDRCFARAGLDLGTSFLNPGSADGYSFEESDNERRPARRDLRAGNGVASPGLLDAAATIGEALVRDAVWHEDRCNWIGTTATAEPGGTGAAVGLGPDLYAGTSGVGLFLGTLAAATGGNASFEQTAAGAIRQALSRLERVERAMPSGLYTGRVGILVAAALVGRLLDSDEIGSRARSGLKTIISLDDFEEPADLLAGRAGAIVGLLALEAFYDDAAHLEAAISLGDELIDSADADPAGWSWRSASHPSRRALTGFAHGAAGVGHALVELFAASGEERYRRAALEAFRYERRWFDPARGNWLDLRDEAPANVGAVGKVPCAFHWCHGAPGIALSRARAYEVLGDPECRGEAEVAAATTQRSLELALEERRGNYSLCHGLCGNADVLLTVSELLGSDGRSARSIAHDVAAAGIDGYVRTGVDWPCGTVGPSPGLMLGMAGIGSFYLRLHDPRRPSPLLVRQWPRFVSRQQSRVNGSDGARPRDLRRDRPRKRRLDPLRADAEETE